MEIKIKRRKIIRNISNIKVIKLIKNLFSVVSYHQVGGSHGNNVSSIPVLVNKFTSTVLIVRVEKRPGNEKRSLLKEETSTTPAASEDDTNGGFFDSITKSV